MNPPTPATHEAGHSSPSFRGRIIVVDGGERSRKATLATLREAGFFSLEASGIQECMELLGAGMPDLILLDAQLRKLSGTDALQILRTKTANADVAIVTHFVESLSDEQHADEATSGADGYITHPTSGHELINRIESILRLKRAEASLTHLRSQLSTEERFSRFADQIDDAFCIFDIAVQRLTYANAAFQRLSGQPDAPINSNPSAYVALIHLQDQDRILRAVSKSPTTFNETYRLNHPDGRVRWHTARAFPIYEAGSVTRLIGAIVRDITDQKQAESLISEQAALLDGAQETIFVQDLGGHVLFWNKSAAKAYGLPAEEMIGKPFASGSEPGHEQHAEAWRHVLDRGDWTGEINEETPDGRPRVIEARWSLVRDSDGAPTSVFCIHSDITERKRLETQFLRAQRMESIGTLAGGIAHDLNNVLSPIVMSIELLKLKHTDIPTLDILDTIEGNAHRGAEMVRQVLSFARGVEGQRLLVQPKYFIKDVQKIAAETFPKNVELVAVNAPDLWNVVGDATQLHQVVLNLCVNARDAMPKGGRITITAQNVLLDESYTAINIEAHAGPHVVIQVQDNGTGMTRETMDKVFDPFFTTKDLGNGTGLGLSSSLAIIRSHGGFIRVYSELGKGTSFKVHLPAKIAARGLSEDQLPLSLPRGHGELIMVIDDEPSIRTITRQTLESFGYRVLLASDGAEAVALFATHQSDVSAVITDMMMPIMDGPATIQVLRRFNPRLAIIAASGLSGTGHVPKVAGLNVRHFLPKPYTAESLLTVLQQVLRGEA